MTLKRFIARTPSHIRPQSLKPTKIGVLISAAIGDTVVFSAVLRDLRSAYPEAKILLFVGGSNRAVVPLLRDFDQAITIPVKNPFRSVQIIRDQGLFDIWIDTGQWTRLNCLYSFLSRSKQSIGFNTPGQFRHFLFDTAVLHSNKIHEIENYRNLLLPLGIKITTAPPSIEFEKGQTEIENSHPNSQPPYAVFHAFAGGSQPHLKEWPTEYWSRLANAMTDKGLRIYFTGLATDRPVVEIIRANCSRPDLIQNRAGELTLPQTAALLAKSKFVVSVNTGVLHVAAATGVFTIGLHGPTSALRWGPLGPTSKGVQSSHHCSPCLNLGFDYGCPRNDCMIALSPKQIVQLINSQFEDVEFSEPLAPKP